MRVVQRMLTCERRSIPLTQSRRSNLRVRERRRRKMSLSFHLSRMAVLTGRSLSQIPLGATKLLVNVAQVMATKMKQSKKLTQSSSSVSLSRRQKNS